MGHPRLENIDNTRDSQLAAMLIALDVPQNASQPFTTMAGHGISGTRFTWHFEEFSRHGDKTHDMIQQWISKSWCETNREHIIAKIKRMFARHSEYASFCKGAETTIRIKDAVGLECHDIYQAASMETLGHPLMGAIKSDTGYRWVFPLASGTDMAIWRDMTQWRDDQFRAEERSDIAYLFCASVMHKRIISELVSLRPMFARVNHGKKSLAIGRDAPQSTIDFFEKKLYKR